MPDFPNSAATIMESALKLLKFLHANIKDTQRQKDWTKENGKLSNQVATRHFVGLDPATIEWVYIIEARRHATRKEIANLCAGKPVKVE
jgi:hypothetical protein